MSNEEFTHRQFWDDSWFDKQIKIAQKKFLEERKKLFYTASEGSLLDRIWNKKNYDKNNNR